MSIGSWAAARGIPSSRRLARRHLRGPERSPLGGDLAAGEVRRFSSQGDLLAVVTEPVPYLSCATLAGHDRPVDNLTAQQLAAAQQSGAFFVAHSGSPTSG